MTVFNYELVTRNYELDSSNHVNNTNYLRYLEEARVNMMYDQGFNFSEFDPSKVQIILYKYICLFKEQIRKSERLVIKSRQIHYKKIKGIVRQEIYRVNTNKLCFAADGYWAFQPLTKSYAEEAQKLSAKFADTIYETDPLENDPPLENLDTLKGNLNEFEVRPYELDANQHVNNAVYSNYFEYGRWSFRKKLFDLNIFKESDLTYVLYKSSISFLKPSFLFEKLKLYTWLVELSPVRVVYWQELHDTDGNVRSTCKAEGCFVNSKGLPVKLPKDVREKFSIFLQNPITRSV